MSNTIIYIIFPIIAYLIGGISFAFVAGKIKGKDLREHGSKNLGATNAGRVLGGKWFLFVFLLDIAKGTIPVIIARNANCIFGEANAEIEIGLLAVSTGLGAVLGHVFSIYHKFKGGKAVATSLGIMIGLDPILGASAFGFWFIVWILWQLITKTSKSNSVGPASVFAAISMPIIRTFSSQKDAWTSPEELPPSILISILSLLIIVKHIKNIKAMFSAKK